MKTKVQKYALSKHWLLAFFLLSLVQINRAHATDRDSLQKVHIEASVKLLNQAIAHNTLKKTATATKYLVDRLGYVSADAQEKIEKVLEYLQKTTGKELYVIITRNPDLVNEKNAKAKFQQEIKDYSQAVFKGSILDEKGGLYTFNFGRIIQKARIGNRQSFQHGVSLVNGSAWKNEEILNEQTIRNLQESSKSLNEKDDFLKANLYALVNKMLNAAGEEFNIDLTSSPSHQKNIGFEAAILGTSNSNAAGSALIVDLPVEIVSSDQQQEDKLKANYVFTPSGQAIYWGGMTKKKFWKSFNGSLIEFTHDKTRYVAIMSRPQFTGGDNRAYTRFWGYYPKTEYQRLKTLEGDRGLPLAKIVNKKSVLSKEFKDNLWFKIKAAKQQVKVYARKYKGVDLDPEKLFSGSEIKPGTNFKNLTFKTNCIEAYVWDFTPSGNITNWGRGTIQENIAIPSNSEKRVGNCETQKLIEEDVKNRNLRKSWGLYVYIYQIQEVKGDETQRQALVKYANEVSKFLQNKYVGLLNFEQKFEGRGASGNYYTIQREQILLALRKLGPNDFEAAYPVIIDGVRVNGGGIYQYKILAQYHPFKEDYTKGTTKVYKIPANYNQNTQDYTIKGEKKKYHYSVQDLVNRHQVFANGKINRRFSNQLLQDEKAGNAYPLSLVDGTEQNKALFGSNSAIFTWFQFALSTGKYVVQEASKIIRGLADQLAKDISVAELPKHWWNPACELRQPKKGQDNCNACKSTYSSIFANIFSVFPPGLIREKHQMEFAFYAGLWNGVVGQVKGVFQLVSLAAGYVSDPKVRKAVQEMKDNLKKKGLWTVIGEEVNKATCNKFVASYSTGKLVVDIATMVLGAPKATAKMLGKVNRLKNFVSGRFGQIAQGTLQVLNKVKQISARLGKGVIRIAKSTAQGAKDVFRILAKGKGKNVDEVIAVVDNGQVKVNKWVDATQNTKSISKESLNGTYHVGETSGGEVGICLKNGVCFIAGTSIYLSSGQFKPIEHIKADDQVYSGNPENCMQRPKDVEVTFVRTTPVLVKLGFLQENIYATPEHPFFNLSNKQILAGNLKKGDTLKTYDGFAIVQSTRSIDTTATVYNFHVQDFHTYFVGKTKLWVHNMMSHFRFDPAIQKKIDDLKITDTKTLDALASDISNSGKLEQALVKNTELVEGWAAIYKADPTDVARLGKNGELVEVRKYMDNHTSKTINDMAQEIEDIGGFKVWSDDLKQALKNAKLHEQNGGYVYNDLYIGEVGKTYPQVQKMDAGYKGEELGKAKLIPWKVPYMSGSELDKCEIFVRNGKLFDFEGKLVKTTGSEAIFVMDTQGGIFIKNMPTIGDYHHSSFLSGGDVSSAGHIVVRDGIFKGINAQTGHYKIPAVYNKQILYELEKRGVSINNVVDFGTKPIDMTKLK